MVGCAGRGYARAPAQGSPPAHQVMSTPTERRSPQLADELNKARTEGPRHMEVRLPEPLSPRQLECLKQIAAGETSARIAASLGISHRTVDHYVAVACAKLGVRTRAQAVARVMALEIIDPHSFAQLFGQ
jgi:DNA-binding CsgD family transcriptional regulator